MSPHALPNGNIIVPPRVVAEAQRVVQQNPRSLTLHDAHGDTIELDSEVEKLLTHILESLAADGHATVTQLPETLTTTMAADILGVSRPTLMKWANAGRIPSTKVGSHTRFSRADVLRLKEAREEELTQAWKEWREFEVQNAEYFAE